MLKLLKMSILSSSHDKFTVSQLTLAEALNILLGSKLCFTPSLVKGCRGFLDQVELLIQFICLLPWLQQVMLACQFVSCLAIRSVKMLLGK